MTAGSTERDAVREPRDPRDDERAVHDDVMSNGRALARNPECAASHAPPFLLATTCEGAAVDLAIRRVATFALVLSGILCVVVPVGGAPLPMLGVPIVWGASALGAIAWVLRRRRSLGAFLVDFEHERVVHWAPKRSRGEAHAWTTDARLVVDDAPDEHALRWVELRIPSGARTTVLRIARADEREARALCRLFRTYRVECVDPQRGRDRDSSG